MASTSPTSAPSGPASNRGFACLWAARDLSALGYWILFVGLLAWSYRMRESAAGLSILLLALMLPPFLLRPLAALTVSSRNARAIAVVAQLLRMAALVPILEARTRDDVPMVLTAVLLWSLPFAFTRACDRALLPALVDAGRLVAAERKRSISRLLVMMAGPVAGMVLVQNAELRGPVGAAMAALLLSAALLFFARPGSGTSATAEVRRASVADLRELQIGLLHALRHPPLKAVALFQFATALIMGGLVAAETAFMVWGLFVGAENLGLLLGAQGAGMAVGVAVHGFLRRRVGANTLVATALGMVAAAQFGLAISESTKAVPAFGALGGLGNGLLLMSLAYLTRELAGPGRGRATSAGLQVAAEAAALLSIVVIGPLTDALSARFALLIAGILLAVLGLFAFGIVANPESSEEKAGAEEPVPPYPLVRPA